MHFDECNLYRGIHFKKVFKAPTDLCFALRVCYIISLWLENMSFWFISLSQPLPDESADPNKDTKILCSDHDEEFLSWYAGIRLAMNGQKLYDNYYNAHLKQIQLEEVEAALPQLQERAYQLSGQRLGKHLEKRREYYQVPCFVHGKLFAACHQTNDFLVLL